MEGPDWALLCLSCAPPPTKRRTATAKGASRHAVTQYEILPGSTTSDHENWNLLCLSNTPATLVDYLSRLLATVLSCQVELQEAERCLCPACPVPGGGADATDHVRRRGRESWTSKDEK